MFEAPNHFPRETILESFSRAFYVTLSTSCGANAPLPRTRWRVCSTQVLHLHTHPPRISRLAPCLGNPMGHVRVEARRMKLPALAACRACATDQGTALHVAAFFANELRPCLDSTCSPRRVHSPKLECRSPGRWLSKRKNSAGGPGTPESTCRREIAVLLIPCSSWQAGDVQGDLNSPLT
jgi:hypothetical protein